MMFNSKLLTDLIGTKKRTMPNKIILPPQNDIFDSCSNRCSGNMIKALSLLIVASNANIYVYNDTVLQTVYKPAFMKFKTYINILQAFKFCKFH